MLVKHREFATSITVDANASEQEGAFLLMPQAREFEWLSQITKLYTFARFRKLKFYFKALTNNVTPDAYGADSNNITRGTMCTVVDYDPTNSSSYDNGSRLFPSKNQMLDTAGSKETPLGRSFGVTIHTNPSSTNNSDLLHTIDGAPELVRDVLRKNYGVLAYRYDGPMLATVDVAIYDVWVDYEVELYKPRSSTLLNPDQAIIGFFTTKSLAHADNNLFGPNGTTYGPKDILANRSKNDGFLSNLGELGGMFVGLPTAADANKSNRIAWQGIPGHVYEITLQAVGSGLSTGPGMGVSAYGDGYEAFNILSGGTSNVLTGGDTAEVHSQIVVKCVGGKTPNKIILNPTEYEQSAGDYWIDFTESGTSWNTFTPTQFYLRIHDMGDSSLFVGAA